MIRLKLHAVIDTLEMKPKDYQEHGDPSSGQGYNYLYEIIGLEKYCPIFEGKRITKDGYAKEFYATGHNGLFSRVRATVREFEKVFCDFEFGALKAHVYGNICKTANRSLAQEQYIHLRNQGGAEHLQDLIVEQAEIRGKSAPAGKTEFYNWHPKRALGKYYQSMTKRAIGEGWEDMKSNNFKGQSGWRLPTVGKELI